VLGVSKEKPVRKGGSKEKTRQPTPGEEDVSHGVRVYHWRRNYGRILEERDGVLTALPGY